jgi:cytosine/adenosine deaminase-related metal-dependent hydrolase
MEGPQDILVEGALILAVGRDLDAGDADVIDATGRIVIPGLVNAHLHSWQTALRGIAYDWSLFEYLMQVHGRVAPLFTPQDMYDGTLAGALNQMASGTTTIGDWCHNNPTPDYTDAAVAALQASGIRARYFHGTPRPHGASTPPAPHPRDEIERLLKGPFAERDGLLTLGIAIPGPMYSPMEVAEQDLRLAQELGLIVSMHHSGGPPPPVDPWPLLDEKGLLGPHVNIVHGNKLSDDNLKRLVDAGVSLTVTPEVEMGDGHGHPITGRLLALGSAPSLGVDIETAVGGEMLACVRIALAHQRALDHDVAQRENTPVAAPKAAEALAWATAEGARALGLGGQIGSIAPGMGADLAVIDARAFNLWPNNNLIATVLQAHSANIEAVMVGGRWRKRDGELLHENIDEIKRALVATAARVANAVGLPSPLNA